MAFIDIDYDKLPGAVKDNLTEQQWREAMRDVIPDGAPVPDSTDYINLKNGQCNSYEAGDPAMGPLLATHNLSGGRGKDSTQFHHTPPGATGR